MDFWKQKFIENFNLEMTAPDIMDLVDEEKLHDYIIEEFSNNFTYAELYDLFKDEMSKEELKDVLEEMGHDFVDLDNEDVDRSLYESIKNNLGGER